MLFDRGSVAGGASDELGAKRTERDNGVKQPAGIYTSQTSPDYFSGNGVLVVLPPGGSLLFLK